MKKLIFIFSGMLIALASNAQTKQLWGMNSLGGAFVMGLFFSMILLPPSIPKSLILIIWT
jgi:cytochrome c biogenesis protein CcdA